MGVKSLWKILDDAEVGKAGEVTSLCGKRVAIDISCWILQSQCANYGHGGIRKPYLRNLFFRTSHLLQHDVEPLFVVDGQAPELKRDELKRRSRIRQEGTANSGTPSVPAGSCDRARPSGDSPFSKEVAQCCELLDCLGLPWIQSEGEAEATCAWLNQQGHVDGVLTEDSDCFLFGAQTIYRNFTANEKAGFMKYTAAEIQGKLSLERTHLVAMALLLGCDYGYSGVKGVGKETVMAWIPNVKEPVKRFYGWREKSSHYESLEAGRSPKKPTHCTKCTHIGGIVSHNSNGCDMCMMSSGCHSNSDVRCTCRFHQQRALYEENAAELKLRREALKDPHFPNEQVVDAFMNPAVTTTTSFISKSPDYSKLKIFLQLHLAWDEEEYMRRVMPVMVATEMKYHGNHIKPVRISKSRTKNGRAMYEVEWSVIEQDDSCPSTQVSLVSRQQFACNYGEMAGKFEEEIKRRKAKATPKKRSRDQSPSQSTLKDFFQVKKVKRQLFKNETSKHDVHNTDHMTPGGSHMT